MSLFLNLHTKTEFPNESTESIDSNSSKQKIETSNAPITSDLKAVITPEKNDQKKAPINIPKPKPHSLPAMKIPNSPRGLKSPKRNPEEKKQSPREKEYFIDIEEIKKNTRKNGQIRQRRILFQMLMIKKLKVQIHRHHKL